MSIAESQQQTFLKETLEHSQQYSFHHYGLKSHSKTPWFTLNRTEYWWRFGGVLFCFGGSSNNWLLLCWNFENNRNAPGKSLKDLTLEQHRETWLCHPYWEMHSMGHKNVVSSRRPSQHYCTLWNYRTSKHRKRIISGKATQENGGKTKYSIQNICINNVYLNIKH